MPFRIAQSRRDVISVICCRRFATFRHKLDFIHHRILNDTQEFRIPHYFRLQVSPATVWLVLQGSLDNIVSKPEEGSRASFRNIVF